MAAPRVFISSTCYDLQEVRTQMRDFITEYGLEPIMSEYGDVFFNYDKNVQDACIEEIKNSQIYILIIGDRFGSFYHKDNHESVTMKEFQQACNINIYKHVFINKFVLHDYKNYQQLLNEEISSEIKKHPQKNTEEGVLSIKSLFDERYSYPREQYKFIFNFIRKINETLLTNNAVSVFETFNDIKQHLKKQWAGFIYDSITKSYDSMNFRELVKTVSYIQDMMKSLVSNDDQKMEVTLNTESLNDTIKRGEEKSNIEKARNILDVILYAKTNKKWLCMSREVNDTDVEKWLSNLFSVAKKHKNEQEVKFYDVYRGLPLISIWDSSREYVQMKLINEFIEIYKKTNEGSEARNRIMAIIKNTLNIHIKEVPILK